MSGLVTKDLRKALSERLADLGLTESTNTLGPEAEPNSIIDRAYRLDLGDDEDSGDERNSFDDCIQIRQQFEVTLTHRAKPKAKADVWDQAYDDRDAVRVAILKQVDDAAQPGEGRLVYRGATSRLGGGGAYRVTVLRWSITLSQELA